VPPFITLAKRREGERDPIIARGGRFFHISANDREKDVIFMTVEKRRRRGGGNKGRKKIFFPEIW